jgi:hypothetical protein
LFGNRDTAGYQHQPEPEPEPEEDAEAENTSETLDTEQQTHNTVF